MNSVRTTIYENKIWMPPEVQESEKCNHPNLTKEERRMKKESKPLYLNFKNKSISFKNV